MTKAELKEKLVIVVKDAKSFDEVLNLIIDYIARNFGVKRRK